MILAMLLEQIRLFIDTNQYNFPELALIIVGYLAVMWLGIVLWVLRDITTRTQNILAVVGSIVLVAIGNILGLILYLLLRPAHTAAEAEQYQLLHHSLLDPQLTVCPECSALIRDSHKFCPDCGKSTHRECAKCQSRIHPSWTYCVECGYDLRPTSRWSQLNSAVAKGVKAIRTKIGLVRKRYLESVKKLALRVENRRQTPPKQKTKGKTVPKKKITAPKRRSK